VYRVLVVFLVFIDLGAGMKTWWRTGACGGLSLLLLTACSGLRTVDTDVTAFPQWRNAPPGPNTAYRFERLPSQQLPQEQQDAVELAARAALAKVGMVLMAAAPRYAVQVVSSSQPVNDGYSGFGGPGVFLGGGSGIGGGGGGGGVGVGLSFPLGRSASSSVRHDLTIVMREVSTQQVVFETRATHGGTSSDKLAVLPAMMDAALRGFPEPPLGTRRINVEVPR
jgi:Domain of unknown function (DUF4136)